VRVARFSRRASHIQCRNHYLGVNFLVDNYNPPKVITQTALWGYAARDAQFQIHAASILPVGDGVCAAWINTYYSTQVCPDGAMPGRRT
jgi:hypothetical protein